MVEKCSGHEAVNVRIINLDDKVKDHDKRIGKLEETNIEIAKINTLLEMVIKQSEAQQFQLAQQHDTLLKVNQNLDGLNQGLTRLGERVDKLENREDDKKIDLGRLAKDIVFKVVPAIVLTYILIQFGLK